MGHTSPNGVGSPSFVVSFLRKYGPSQRVISDALFKLVRRGPGQPRAASSAHHGRVECFGHVGPLVNEAARPLKGRDLGFSPASPQ